MLSLFIESYITCSLWSSLDDNGEPLDDNYSVSDISKETREQMQLDCERFYSQNYDLIKDDVIQAGHDFWLTRNGHGAGFWDGDWPEHGEYLTDACKAFGECDLYIGDDGLIYS